MPGPSALLISSVKRWSSATKIARGRPRAHRRMILYMMMISIFNIFNILSNSVIYI